MSDPDLPAAGKHSAPSPAWQTLTIIRDWRASLVLQRVRLLTESEAVLVTLPLAVRCAFPSTSRVLPRLQALAHEVAQSDPLGPADRLKLDRLAASLTDVLSLTARIKELDRRIPTVLHVIVGDGGC